MPRAWLLLGLVAGALVSLPAQTPFNCDAAAPPDYRQSLAATRDAVSICDASFASHRGGRAQCSVVAPDRKEHRVELGGGQNRTGFLPDTVALARSVAVSVLLDAH